MVTVAALLPPFMQKITNKLPEVVLMGTVIEVFPLAEKLCAAWTTEKAGTRLVSEKLAGLATPATDAVTVYGPPPILLAVKTGAVATPWAFVVAVFTPPANVPLAPLAGAVKVTVTPFTGLFEASFTVACRSVANAVLVFVLCGVPPVAVILAGVPARLLSEKLAEVATPAADAVTL